MKNDCEVIVVGAGPSGSITAILLAQLGHEVILLDKSGFPRQKVCGDAIPLGASRLLNELGMKDSISEAINRKKFLPFNRVRLVSPSGYVESFELNQHGNNSAAYMTAPREHFDYLLHQLALEKGVKFRRAKVESLLIDNDKVIGVRTINNKTNEVIRSRVVVGADGANSILARNLRFGNQHLDEHRAIANRAYIRKIKLCPGEIEFYFYKQFLPGYAWIFPVGEDAANIGLGMRYDKYIQGGHNLKAMIDNFLAVPTIRRRLMPGWEINNLAAWPLNFGSQKGLSYAFNGALLVGDAAGFVSPLTGGGILSSIVSGKIAADVLHKALKADNLAYGGIKTYELRCKKEILPELRRLYFIQKLLFAFPTAVDHVVKLGQYRYSPLQRWINRAHL